MKIEELRTKRTTQNFKRKSKKISTADFKALTANKEVLKDVNMRKRLIRYQMASFVLVSDGPLNSLAKLEQMHKLGNSTHMLCVYLAISSFRFCAPSYPKP